MCLTKRFLELRKYRLPNGNWVYEVVGGIQATKSKVVLVLDTSGSMGSMPKEFLSALKRSLLNAGYDQSDYVDVITFDNQTIKQSVRIDNLHRMSLTSGGTYMKGVPRALKESISDPSQTYTVFMVSDGNVFDMSDTHLNLNTYLGNCYSNVTVHMIRYGTAGDTFALAKFASISPHHSDVLTIGSSGVSTCFDKRLTSIVHVNGEELSLDGVTFTSSICVSNGTTFIGSGGSISIDGYTIDVIRVPENSVLASQMIEKFASQQLPILGKLLIARKDIDRRLQFLKEMEATYDSLCAMASGPADTVPVYLRDRIRIIRHRLEKANTSVFTAIREFENRDKVTVLNSQQGAADWLRQLSETSRSDRHVARRATKSLGDQTPDQIVEQLLKELRSLLDTLPTEDPAGADVSFFSQCTALEAFRDGLQEAIKLLDEFGSIAATDVMTLLGFLGIPVLVKQGSYPDPWAVKILKVYEGFLLNEADLYTALQQGGQLTFPGQGPDALVNAVIPILSLNKTIWGPLRKLADLHASASIRQTLTPISGDRSALRGSAVQFLLNNSSSQEAIPEVRAQSFWWLLQTIQYSLTRTNFGDIISGASAPGAYMTGDNEISHSTKLFTMFLGIPKIAELVKQGHVFHAIMEYIQYFHVRRTLRLDDDRTQILHEILGIDTTTGPKAQEPMTPEPEDISFPAEFDIDQLYEALVSRKLLVNANLIANFLRFTGVTTTREFTRADIESLPPFDLEKFVQDTFNVSLKTYMAVMGVLALQTVKEVDRVDKETRTVKYPTFSSEEEIAAYLRRYIVSQYQEAYNATLDEKEAREREMMLKTNISNLLSMSFGEDWIALLCKAFPNRQAIGFADFSKMILAQESSESQAKKLGVLVSGRLLNGDVVWAGGNVLRVGRIQYLDQIRNSSTEMASSIEKIIKENNKVYIYRDGPLNRHGHGNDFPSYWAFGFNNLEEYRLSVSSTVYNEYMDRRESWRASR
jgi:hypothetical protein